MHDHMKGTRGKAGEAPPQLVLGEFHHSRTTPPYSSSPSLSYHFHAMASQQKIKKQREGGVSALSKLKELATARPAPGVGNVLVMQHIYPCPLLGRSKLIVFYKI